MNNNGYNYGKAYNNISNVCRETNKNKSKMTYGMPNYGKEEKKGGEDKKGKKKKTEKKEKKEIIEKKGVDSNYEFKNMKNVENYPPQIFEYDSYANIKF